MAVKNAEPGIKPAIAAEREHRSAGHAGVDSEFVRRAWTKTCGACHATVSRGSARTAASRTVSATSEKSCPTIFLYATASLYCPRVGEFSLKTFVIPAKEAVSQSALAGLKPCATQPAKQVEMNKLINIKSLSM